MEFAAPLLEAGPESPPREQVEGVLDFASAIWNSAVLEEETGSPTGGILVNAMVKHLGLSSEESRALVEQFFRRKKEMFGDDHRTILDLKVIDEGDSYRVIAASVETDLPPRSKLTRIIDRFHG